MKIAEKERLVKKRLVEQVHVNKDGVPRKISFKDSKSLWMTIMPDGKKLYGTTEDILLDKLMDAYSISISSNKVSVIFKDAISRKDRTESVNPETLYQYESSFKRFIDDTIANMDITKITYDYLAEYTLNKLRSMQETDSNGVTIKVKKKAFLEYKTVLNLIFDYAIMKEIIVINPLSKFKNNVFLKECDCSKATNAEKIFSEDEITLIQNTVRKYMDYKRYDGYFINGYAILLSIETGMRVAELPALKWSDIKSNHIHIHSQQLSNRRKGGKEYYLVNWTKDEKGVSKGGRKFPLTTKAKDLLMELKAVQQEKGILSEFVFCNADGEWIKTDAYITCLRRLLKSMGFDITNNHAFRMSLNSNVLAGTLNLPVAKRAELLGHSVETNMMYYTYATKDDMDDLVSLFDNSQVSPRSHPNVVEFAKKESPESTKFKAFN